MRGNTALAQAFAYDYEVDAEPTPVENVIPIGQRRTLLELNEQTCRWPIGDPATQEFYFCGGSAIDEPALLRLSLAHRLSAAGGAPRQAAGIASIADLQSLILAAVRGAAAPRRCAQLALPKRSSKA